MKNSLQLKLGHSLTITPQLQQAIRLLQLSSMELRTEIQDMLESNIMLETGEEGDTENEAQPTELPSETGETDMSIVEAIPEELPIDSVWEDVYGHGITQYRDSPNDDFYNHRSNENTLREHLLEQLNLLPLSNRDQFIAVAVIDALDDNGYLRCSLTEVRDLLNRELNLEEEEAMVLDEVATVLHIVQAMEPAGVAAQDLQECLKLQLRQCAPTTPFLEPAKQAVENYFDLLSARNFSKLMKCLQLDQSGLEQVTTLIRSMNPRPAAYIRQLRPEYITPDLYVKKHKGRWQVALNVDSMPRLRVNNIYAKLIRRTEDSRDNNALKNHLQEARWFIRALRSRSETLLNVAGCIVRKQWAFLEYGEEAMRPMTLKDVATALGMHESTVSRVTTRKYMDTPRGLFELKYFFPSCLETDYGGEVSSAATRATIKKLIDAESPQKPLSDNKIAALLWEEGIKIARRTIAKYREAIAIPSSNKRKQLYLTNSDNAKLSRRINYASKSHRSSC